MSDQTVDELTRPADAGLPGLLAAERSARIEAERGRCEAEHIAHVLQRSLLPPCLPDIPGVELSARYHPAGDHAEVGGDFYDAFSLGEGRWGFLIGDVAGKGPGAAAMTAVVRHTARATVRVSGGLRVPEAVNAALIESDDDETFATMAYGELRLAAGHVAIRLLSCGHPPALLVRAGGHIVAVEGRGPLLGQFPVINVDPVALTLFPGDVLVLVTDGVLEARAPRSALQLGPCFLEEEGLVAVLAETRGQP
ncbi:MAG: SpoIIE family protein phosphatase, partial [Actinomycetota bacterium]|nr:SpoIIE family protein phosphatase [Actinomycetota bacterium]